MERPRTVNVDPFPGNELTTLAGRLRTVLVACERFPDTRNFIGADRCLNLNSIRWPSSSSQPLFSTVPPLTICCAPSPAVASGCVVVKMSDVRSEEHTSELQSQSNLVCRLLLEK